MVVAELDTLRKTSTSCQTVAFADLSTQMILVTDTQSTLPREALDTLCKQAASVLDVSGKAALGVNPARMALVADKTSVRLFFRAPDEPSDVICCVCTPDVDVAQFVADATDCLNRISNG